MKRALASVAAVLRAAPIYLPTATVFSPSQIRLLVRLTVIIYAAGALVGALLELGAFADGGFFIYGMASGDPWHLNWNAMPVRVSTYLLTIAPITELVRSHLLPISNVGWLYSLWFLSVPFLFLLLGIPLVVRERRAIIAYPAIQLLTTGLFLYGFVTDLWVTQGEFWIALFALIGGTADRRRVPAFAIAFALMLFSHDAAILLALLIVAALFGRMLGLAPSGEMRRKTDLLLLGYAIALIVVWVVTKMTWVYPDPVLARAIAHGALGLVNPVTLIRSKLFLLAFVTAVGFGVIIAWRTAPPTRLTAAVLLVASAAAAWAVYAVGAWPGSRYMLRGVVLTTMLLFGALAVVDTWRVLSPNLREPIGKPAPRVAWAVLLVLTITVQQVVHNVAFAHDWANYRRIVRSLSNGTAHVSGQAVPVRASLAAARLSAHDRRLLRELSWGFALPFQSFVFSENYRIDRMLYNPVSMPFGCAAFHRALARPSPLPIVARARIVAHVCAHQPRSRDRVGD